MMDYRDFEEQLREAKREVERERQLMMDKVEVQNRYLINN